MEFFYFFFRVWRAAKHIDIDFHEILLLFLFYFFKTPPFIIIILICLPKFYFPLSPFMIGNHILVENREF